MSDRPQLTLHPAACLRSVVSGLLLLSSASVGWAQTPQSPPLQALPSQAQPTQPPAEPPPVVQAAPDQPLPANRPGFLDEVGKFFKDPPWGLPPLKSPTETWDDLNARTKDATDNLTRFSKGQVVAGRIRCPVAANGAPDCKSAATKLCTDKGYKEGQSVDSDSAESCPASVILSGKKDDFRQCHVDNYVIRALCQ